MSGASAAVMAAIAVNRPPAVESWLYASRASESEPVTMEGRVNAFVYSFLCRPLHVARWMMLSRGQSWMTTRSFSLPRERKTGRPSPEYSAPPTRMGVPSGSEKTLPQGTLRISPSLSSSAREPWRGRMYTARPPRSAAMEWRPFVIQILSSPWMASSVPKNLYSPSRPDLSRGMREGLAVG